MGPKSLIVMGLLVVIAGAVAMYGYDSSNRERIAAGVTVAGVSVGGLEAGEARRKLRRAAAASLRAPIAATHGKQRFILSAGAARIGLDVRGMVAAALRASREGNVFSRAVRDLTGGAEDVSVPARVTYSPAAVDRFVTRVRRAVDRPAKDAQLDFPSLDRVKEQDGRRVRAAKLRADIGAR